MPRRARAITLAVATLLAACQGSGRTATSGSTTTTVPPPAATSTVAPTVPAPTTTTRPSTSSPTAAPSTSVPAGPAQVVSRGRGDRKLVALTFDAGSDAGNAGAILDVLSAHHIPATFGITGLWAQANPALVRRISSSGHQIVDHSWDHKSFTGASTGAGPLSAVEIRRELDTTDALIRSLTGSGTDGWFRPPYGDRSPEVDATAGAAGYRYELMWTVDTLGWKGVDPATVVQRAVAVAAPGEIILMHVGSQSTDAAALPALITALQARGYGFATVADII